MSSLLAQHMSRLRNEAKTNFKSNIIYFLDAPNLEHLGFKAKIIGTPKEYQESLLRLNGTELHQEITSASQLIDEKVKFINNIISDFINQKLDLKVKLVNEQLVAHDPDTASKLRLLEINSFLAQQCKLKGSVYFLNSLKAYLQIYPIAYLLQTQGYEDSKLNLDAPVLSSFNSEQKERIKRMSLLFSKSNDACARLSLTAKFAKALCGQNDLGIIYGCALLGLDGLLSSFNELLSLHPNLEVESFINQLAKSFKNEHPVALLRFKDFLVSDSFIRFSSTKNNPNQNQNHPAHQQQRPHAPYIANKSNKGLILTVASDHDATTPAPHGLVLTNAAAAALASEQANNSNSQQDKSSEPLAKIKTAKAAPSASGLVLTNAADSQSDSSSNSQQNKGTEPLAENKTAKASAIASGLVLTNAADSVQDNSSNSQQDNGTEPLAENKTAKAAPIASGLVLTNAADSVQDNSSNSQQNKDTEPLAETKTAKASTSASGLVLTNAADSVQDNSSKSQQDKGTEPLAETKTAKASASASGLVLTNAADSVQDNSSTSQQGKDTEPLAETKTAKASASASGLVLTNAADSVQDNSSNSQQDKDTEPLAETKTAKANHNTSGLVLTNAADSVQDNSSNSQQDKGTEPLADNKTAKAAPIASGLVLTNAADSVQDNSSNSQQDKGTEPLSENKTAKAAPIASGLVLTNAADSVQENSSTSQQDKSTEPLAETKTAKASANASGLVLTNAADSVQDNSSTSQQDKSTEPLAENKTAKAAPIASGLVLTNAADSVQENSSTSQQDKGTEPLAENKTAKASASASGLVLTNAADSVQDNSSNSLQVKSTEPLAETKTAKASASTSGLVLTNAADSVQDNSSTTQQDKDTEPLAETKTAKASASTSGLVLTNAAAIIQEGSKGNSVKTNFSGEQSANLLITTEQYEHAPISKEELFVQNFYSRNLQAIPNVSEKSFSQRAQERYLSILDRIDNNAKENDGKKVFRVAKSIKEEAIKDTSSPEQVNDASKVNSDIQDQAPKVQVIWKTMDGSQPNFEAKTQETTAKASTEALPQGSGHEIGSNVANAAITTAVSTASTEDKGSTTATSTATATAAAATATATETGVTVVKSATGIETKDDSISKNSEDTIISRVTDTSDIVTEDSKPKVKAKSAKTSGTTKKKTTGGLKRIKLSNASAGDIWQQAVDLAKDMDSEGSKVLTKEEFKASMETQEQTTTSMVTTATTGESVDKSTLSQSASNGAIKTDADTEAIGSKGTASDNSTSNTGKSMPTGTAFMPFEQARRSNIKVLASRHVNDQVIEKDQAAVKIHKGSSSNIGKINPADALRHFDPITGSYIDERPVESEVEVTGESDFNQDSGQFFDNDSLNFDENLIFGDDETFEIWSPDEPNNKDDNQFNEETDLNLDKTLECSNELMRLKYTVLFAQSFLLDQEQYQKLMSAKNLEQLNMYSQLMSSFDDFSELNIEHTSALPNWQTIRASLLTQVINDVPNMPAYKSVLFDLLSRTKDEELSLTKQLAKFNYYNRVIGHTWEVEANNPQGPYANKEQASLAKFENSPGATFILACLFLNISQLHNYACDCFLGSAYTNCGLASPI